MKNFKELIEEKTTGIILYGLTPPKGKNTRDKIIEISDRRKNRISNVNIDGVVIYDIQDEVSRSKKERPFPFLPTIEPTDYFENYFNLDIPVIFYQSIGKYELKVLQNRISQYHENAFVFVGSPSKSYKVKTSLENAYKELDMAGVLLGGVTIPERHSIKKNENERIIRKMASRCSFFISQCVYDAAQFKDLLSDLYYSCKQNQIPIPTIIMTVSPCGSQKTVELFKWLGVRIPRWIENDIINSIDTLNKSVEHAVTIVQDVMTFAIGKGIPFGCNIESISIKKDEVIASFDLVNRINRLFKEAGIR